MITATQYIKPNITIEIELIGFDKFYIYNYQGVHYRVFNSLESLQMFLNDECFTCCFEFNSESELNKFLYISHEKNK